MSTGWMVDGADRKTSHKPSGWFANKPDRDQTDPHQIDKMAADPPVTEGTVDRYGSPTPDPSDVDAQPPGDAQPWFRGNPPNQYLATPSHPPDQHPASPGGAQAEQEWFRGKPGGSPSNSPSPKSSAVKHWGSDVGAKLKRMSSTAQRKIERVAEEFKKYTSPLQASMSPLNGHESHFDDMIKSLADEGDVKGILFDETHPSIDAPAAAEIVAAPDKEESLAWFIQKDKRDTKLTANCRMFKEKTDLERRLQSAHDKRRDIRKQVAEKKKLAQAGSGTVESWLTDRFQTSAQIDEKYALVIQRKWRRILTRRSVRKNVLLTLYAPNMVRDRRRNEVLSDVVQLQIKFTHALHMMLLGYKYPLEDELTARNHIKSGILTSARFELIFFGVKEILELHTEVLEEILIISEDYPRMSPGNAMFAMFQRLTNSHGDLSYMSNYDRALEVLQDCDQEDDFKAFMKVQQSSQLCQGVDLRSLLFMPFRYMQRMQELFTALVQLTDPSNPDYEGCQRTIEIISSVVAAMNEQSQVYSVANQKLGDLIRSIYGNPTSIHQGSFVVCSSDCEWHAVGNAGSSEIQRVHVVLLSDCVILKFRGYMGYFSILAQIPLDCALAEVPMIRPGSKASQEVLWDPQVTLRITDQNGKVYFLSWDSQKERASWLEAFEHAQRVANVLDFVQPGVTKEFFEVMDVIWAHSDTGSNLKELTELQKNQQPQAMTVEGVPFQSPTRRTVLAPEPLAVVKEPDDNQDEVCRTVYSALRALEARFGMMERTMMMQEQVLMDDVSARLVALESRQAWAAAQSDHIALANYKDTIDVPSMLDELFGELDMLQVDDEDHHLMELLTSLSDERETLKIKAAELDPKIEAIETQLSNLTVDLEFDRRSVIMSMKQRGYAYSLDRSRVAQRRRTQKELVAKFYFLQLNFINTMQFIDKVTARVRTVLGNLSTMMQAHKMLLRELDRSEEMGSTLMIGSILEKFLMPILVQFLKYGRGFDQSLSTLATLNQSGEIATLLEQHKMDDWGGIDLPSILWLPVDHLHRTSAVLAEMVQINQQEVEYRTHEDACQPLHKSNADIKTTDYVNSLTGLRTNLSQLERVHNKVLSTCDEMYEETTNINKSMSAVKDLQTELCGDFTNFVIPGRREIAKGRLIKVTENTGTEVNAHLFHDILLTATDGASGYRVFSSKANLLHASVTVAENNDKRFKVTERDCVTQLVVAVHIFEAPSAAEAVQWMAQIKVVSNVLGKALRCSQQDEPERIPGAVLAKQKERLEQQMVQLQREIKMLVEEETKFDFKLDQTMADFQQLRTKQWDIDYDRMQVGLQVDNRTREALEESASPGAKRRVPKGMTQEEQKATSEQRANAVGAILDSLTRKLDGLEDVLSNFALEPVKPVPQADCAEHSAQDKIQLEELAKLIEGEWRMYCCSDDSAFSYALVIKNVRVDPSDPYSFTWDGRSHVEGRYSCEEGSAVWDPATSKAELKFTEVWHEEGLRDGLQAQLKRNGKFQCVSKAGCVQKARKEDTMPKDAASRSMDPYRKYYVADRTHAKQADRYSVDLDSIPQLLSGEWRMFCKPNDCAGFSYGLIISEVTVDPNDANKFNWKGKSRAEDKYVCEDATATYDPDSHKVQLAFTEFWHQDGTRDALVAQLKANGKFTCQSAKGFVQKARKEDTMPGSAVQRSSGVYAKYYIGDTSALLEDDPAASISAPIPDVYHDADDVFWTVIARVRSSLGGIDDKLAHLDQEFWKCRRITDRQYFGGLSSPGLKDKVVALEKTLSEEHRLFDLKKDELRKLEHKRDHALSALQITKKKVIFAGKLDNMPIMRHSTTLE